MKRIIWISFILLLLLPTSVMAHSTLEQSTPAQGETVTVSPDTISLTYNTKIEKLSKFKLVDANNQEITPANLTVEGDTMSGSIEEPLANGAYAVNWTIIGADGHVVDGSYSFTVNAAEATAEPSPSVEPTASPEQESSPSPEPTTEQGTDSSNNDQPLQDQESTNYMPAIIIGIIIVAAALFLFLRRRKS